MEKRPPYGACSCGGGGRRDGDPDKGVWASCSAQPPCRQFRANPCFLWWTPYRVHSPAPAAPSTFWISEHTIIRPAPATSLNAHAKTASRWSKADPAPWDSLLKVTSGSGGHDAASARASFQSDLELTGTASRSGAGEWSARKGRHQPGQDGLARKPAELGPGKGAGCGAPCSNDRHRWLDANGGKTPPNITLKKKKGPPS